MKTNLLLFLTLVICVSCGKESSKSLLDKGIPLEMAEFRSGQVSNVVYALSFGIPEELSSPINSRLELSLDVNDLTQPLYLDFNEQSDKIKSVVTNGNSIPVDHREEHLIIESQHLNRGKNQLVIDFDAGELSLNRNEDFLYTLLVPDRASTLFPCFDQPDIKANYILDITAPSNWVVLCGAPIENQLQDGGFKKTQFAMTEKMSTYLFSFVAGEFETISQNPGEFDMTLLYRETNEEKKSLSIDEIFKVHQQSIDFLKAYTGYPFPFQKLDFACIPGFQYGGMEHVGAIQYRESSLFLDNSATESRKLGRGKLIAHETAHMWFGDLVTMKWFNDVWMKEVFANFMADKIVNPVFPQINHNLQFVTNHYPAAYSEDRTKGTNPIRQPLDNLKNAGTLYGRIIYNKAPIMMRQLEKVMGDDKFQEGIKEYIATYANGNADWNELINILDEKTDLDMRAWSDVWVNQSGRPIFSSEISYGSENRIELFEISQKAEDGSNNVWPQSFEVSLIYPDSILDFEVQISGATYHLEAAGGLPKPEAIVYNSNGFGYGIFPVEKDQLNVIPSLTNEVARAYSYINCYENTLAGNTQPTKAFSLFKQGLKTENNELIVQLLSRQLRTIFWKYLKIEERDKLQFSFENQLLDQLKSELPSNIKKTVFNLFRSIAYSDEGKEKLYQIWSKSLLIQDLKLNKDDYSNIAMDLAIFGHPKYEEILKEALEALENPDKKERFAFLMPSLSKHSAERDLFFESLKEASNREKEAWVQTAANNIHHPLRHSESTKHLKMSLDLLEEIQQTGDIFFPKRWLLSTVGNYSSNEAYSIVEGFLNENPEFSPVLKNKLLQSVDDLYRIQGGK